MEENLKSTNENMKKELEDIKKRLESKDRELYYNKLELGRIGRWFGGKDIAALNISGFVLILLILIGVTFTLLICFSKCGCTTIRELWGIFTPLIATIIGYMLGNKGANNMTK